MSTYPDYPGHKGGETSQEAAEAISEHLGRLQAMVRALIAERTPMGLTAHETAHALDMDKAAIQPRLSELRRKGLIVDSGQRRRNESGKRAIVWVAKPERANG